MKRPSRSLDEIGGVRATCWIRESTTPQYDRYGPSSQREQQSRFIERYGLADTDLVFQVAHSGTTGLEVARDGGDAGRGAGRVLRPPHRGLHRSVATQSSPHPRAARGPDSCRWCRSCDVRPPNPQFRSPGLGRVRRRVGVGREAPILAQVSAIKVDSAMVTEVVAALGSQRRPVSIDRARLERQLRELAIAHAAGEIGDNAYLASHRRLRSELDARD